ncbi:MAG: hypothetical protein ASARMPRED_003339 [Alectoria sarmentosa]|nr:MAG: hypothetical protein ASARMPRED_003339 [Alectoria sarmentosa]
MAFQYTASNSGLQLLQSFLGLKLEPSRSRVVDEVVFVAIDFEYLQNFEHYSRHQELNSQIGIAVLDSRILISSPPRRAISTCNFVTGSPYCAATIRKFLFGETSTIYQRDILSTLESLIPRRRNIVLVGHGFWHDLRILRPLNFDLHISIVGILDTGKMASKMFPNVSITLGSILSELQCPFQNLHTAGNDAYYTLRALLLLATRSYRGEIVNDLKRQDTLTALEAITEVPVPRRSDPQAKSNKKKRKRFQRNRKHRTK